MRGKTLLHSIVVLSLVVFFLPMNVYSSDDFTGNTVDSQTRFNFGRATAVSGTETIHQVWVEVDPLTQTGTAEVKGTLMYRVSPDGGVNWSGIKQMTDMILTGYPKISAFGPYVAITYHERDTVTEDSVVYIIVSASQGFDWVQLAQGVFPPPTGVGPDGAFPSIAMYGDFVHVTYSAPESPATSNYTAEVFYRVGQISNPGFWIRNPQLVSEDPDSPGAGDGFSSWTPDIAVDGAEVYIVWTDERHNSLGDCGPMGDPEKCFEEVYMRRSLDLGGSWEAEQRVTNTPDKVGHNAASVFVAYDDNGNPGNPVAHIAMGRKTEIEIVPGPEPVTELDRDIYYVRATNGGTVIESPILIAKGQLDPPVKFGRPSVVADKNRVQIAYHVGTAQGGRVHLAELDNYGANFILVSVVNFVLPGTPVGWYEIQQPSLIVDGNGKSHLICTYRENFSDTNLQLLYKSWSPPAWVSYP